MMKCTLPVLPSTATCNRYDRRKQKQHKKGSGKCTRLPFARGEESDGSLTRTRKHCSPCVCLPQFSLPLLLAAMRVIEASLCVHVCALTEWLTSMRRGGGSCVGGEGERASLSVSLSTASEREKED